MASKIDWYWIPISIVIFIVLLIIMLYSVFAAIIAKLVKKLEIDMREICDYTYTPIPITASTSYNTSNSYSLVEICGATSAWAKCGRKMVTIPGFEVIETFALTDPFNGEKHDNAILMYSQSQNIAIISFSGTVTLSEWLDDLDFEDQKTPAFLQDSSDILVQASQCSMYESMRDDILKGLVYVSNTETFVYCIGHSLGGVLASLCFLDITTRDPYIQTALYTFGAPRHGNNAYAEAITKTNRAYRVVNTEDVVPSIPPPVIGDSVYYTHYGKTVPFNLNLKSIAHNHTIAYGQGLKKAMHSL